MLGKYSTLSHDHSPSLMDPGKQVLLIHTLAPQFFLTTLGFRECEVERTLQIIQSRHQLTAPCRSDLAHHLLM